MQFDTIFFLPPVLGMTNLTPGLLLLLLLKSRLLGLGGFLEVTRDSVLELQAFFLSILLERTLGQVIGAKRVRAGGPCEREVS